MADFGKRQDVTDMMKGQDDGSGLVNEVKTGYP
jgi:hypothetical protein